MYIIGDKTFLFDHMLFSHLFVVSSAFFFRQIYKNPVPAPIFHKNPDLQLKSNRVISFVLIQNVQIKLKINAVDLLKTRILLDSDQDNFIVEQG